MSYRYTWAQKPPVDLYDIFASFPLIAPLKIMMETQPFGANYVDFYRQLGMLGHNGYDLRAKMGTPIMAPCDGVVSWAYDQDRIGYGVVIFLETEPKTLRGVSVKIECVFAHLDKLNVKTGDAITRGDIIGWTDNTGQYTTGPHLHFGVRPYFNGVWHENGYRGYIDPKPFLDEVSRLPVDYRYDIPRTWRSYMTERAFAFDRFTIKWLKRLPNNREIAATAYGGWPLATLTDPAMFQVWSMWTHQQYEIVFNEMKNGRQNTDDIGAIIIELEKAFGVLTSKGTLSVNNL